MKTEYQYREDFDRLWRAALVAEVEKTPGLTVRTDIGVCEYLMWDDDPMGCYPVGFGLSGHPNIPREMWPTFLWLNYVTDAEGEDPFGGKRPFDLDPFFSVTSRDVEMLAAIAVVAAKVAQRRRNAWAEQFKADTSICETTS
jgi:hypothetical protein